MSFQNLLFNPIVLADLALICWLKFETFLTLKLSSWVVPAYSQLFCNSVKDQAKSTSHHSSTNNATISEKRTQTIHIRHFLLMLPRVFVDVTGPAEKFDHTLRNLYQSAFYVYSWKAKWAKSTKGKDFGKEDTNHAHKKFLADVTS